MNGHNCNRYLPFESNFSAISTICDRDPCAISHFIANLLWDDPIKLVVSLTVEMTQAIHTAKKSLRLWITLNDRARVNRMSVHSLCHIPAVKTHHYIISLSDHYILSREWIVIVDQVLTNCTLHFIQWGVAELLIMSLGSHYARMCFKSVNPLGALHS